MTTDQPQWMKDAAAAHAARRLSPKASTDQPTPPPSLEEARVQVMRAMGFDERIARRAGTEEEQEAWAEYAAAARAEVIREVEAALEDHEARLAQGGYWPTSAIQLVARLRALSQGGEGKA